MHTKWLRMIDFIRNESMIDEPAFFIQIKVS